MTIAAGIGTPAQLRAAARGRPEPDGLAHSTYGLALATMAVGLSGHSVAGLAPMMEAHLQASAAAVGQLVTVFAVTCAVSGPLLAVATSGWERRRLLIVALAVTAGGNALAAVAPNYLTLLCGRVATALGAATTTAVAVGIAAQANRSRLRARAMAVVLAGLTVALVVGVPAASALAQTLGYQKVLWIIAWVCVLVAAVIGIAAPVVDAPPGLPLRERLAVAGRRRVLFVLGAGMLAWTSCFTVYPYLAALLTTGHDAAGLSLSWLLAGYGLGAAAGNLTAGGVADRLGPRLPLLAATAGAAALLIAAMPAARGPIPTTIVLALWGFVSWSVNPATNSWLVHLEPAHSAVLLALNGSAVYLGMGLGGVLGGVVISTADAHALAPVAGVVAVLACLLIALTALPPLATGGRHR